VHGLVVPAPRNEEVHVLDDGHDEEGIARAEEVPQAPDGGRELGSELFVGTLSKLGQLLVFVIREARRGHQDLSLHLGLHDAR
jgi:hypothetical protein